MPAVLPASAPASAAPAAEDGTSALYRAAIGPIGANHYVALFNAMDDAQRNPLRWNWAASLCTLNWLLFRQLWKAAIYYCGAVVAAALLIFGIGRLIFDFSDTTEWTSLAGLMALLFILPGLFGNAVLHADCRRRMTLALRASADETQACKSLEHRASSRRRLIVQVVLNVAAALMLAFAVTQWSELSNRTGALADAQRNQEAPVQARDNGAPITAPATSASSPSGRSVQGSIQAEPTHPGASQPQPAASLPQALAAVPQTAASGPAVTASSPAVTASSPTATPSKPALTALKSALAASKPRAAKTTATFLINVGLFAVQDNARSVYVKLRNAGLPATSQTFATSKGARTRVRVGPYETRQQAQAAIDKVRALGLDAMIVVP